MDTFHDFVPKKSVNTLQCWIDDLDVVVIISKPRKTKLGDFKYRNNRYVVSVNKDLNPYSFLITLTHELAHAYVYKKHGYTVKSHGLSWQLTFKYMMLNFLTLDYFPEDVLNVLAKHLIKPKASSLSDESLARVLRKYNLTKSLTVSDIAEGDNFLLSNGKVFVKGKKLRKRFKCIEKKTQKVYLFHPLAEVIDLQ